MYDLLVMMILKHFKFNKFFEEKDKKNTENAE